MKNWSIGFRLVITFVLIGVLALIAVGAALYGLNTAGNAFEDFENRGHKSTAYIKDAQVEMYQMAYSMLEMSMTEDAELMGSYKSTIEGCAQNSKDLLQSVANLNNGGSANLKNFSNAITEYTAAVDECQAYFMNNDNAHGISVFYNKVDPLFNEVVRLSSLIDDEIEGTARDIMTATFASNTLTIRVALGVLLVAFIMAYLMATMTRRSITIPLKEIKNAADGLSRGELHTNITYVSRNELGQLAESMRSSMNTLQGYIKDIGFAMTSMADGNFNIAPSQPFIGDFESIEKSIITFITTMSDTLAQIGIVSSQVSTGADQVAGGSHALAQGATEQASAVEELAATISDISIHITNTAQNSNEAEKMSLAASGAVTESNQKMQSMMGAMQDISDKSRQIEKIIKTIEDIAFQTNILALNAAVEAARAGGTAGKGFAVVADEVRNLASKSAEAAKNTTQLIESSITAVDHGTTLAEETANALLGIVDSSQATTSLITEINHAASEQSNSVSQIKIGMDQISAVVQTNSATSEQSAAAAEELSGQATMLRELLAKFKTRSNSADGFEKMDTVPSYNAAPAPFIPAPVNYAAEFEPALEYDTSSKY